MSRRKGREYALKALYLIDASGIAPDQAIAEVHELEEVSLPMDEFANSIVMGTMGNLAAIDSIIKQYAIGWSLTRMAIIDRVLLRIAIYEMFYEDDIPVSVSINEAVELANKYSTDDSGKFINGILGKIIRDNELTQDSCQL